MKKQILTMGGGGFSMEPENIKLDEYLLSLSAKDCPNICFVGTASGDDQGYIDRFYSSFENFNCNTNHLALYKPPEGNLREFVLKQDVFYVGGGSTRNLLVLWKEWKLDLYLKEAYENGAVLGGISAGSICWFEQGLTDSVTGKLLPLDCLGFLKGSNCPHYDGEKKRRPAYEKSILDGEMKNGIACDDGVAAHFIDGELYQFVSSRKGVSAYKVALKESAIEELKLKPKYL